MNAKIIGGGILLLVGVAITLATVKIHTVRGDEIGVLETWGDGVQDEPLLPKTYIWVPGFNKTPKNYSVSQQVFVMNNNDSSEFAEGRDADAYSVQSAEGQDMTISLTVQWRRDPLKVVDLHKTVRDNIEERLIRPEVMRVVKDQATTRTALEAYSGQGLVSLQSDIEDLLTDETSDLRARGVIIDTFVIEKIELDPEYIKEIKLRQVAVQARLKNIEQTKAAEAAAEKAKAEAQADYEKQIVEAKRDKERGVLEAEKRAQQEVLAAEAAAKKVELAAIAEKNRNIAVAEGEKEAGLLRAQAIIAVGNAEAEAIKQKMNAYAGSGSDKYVQMQVAGSMAEAFKGITGYLPESMNITVLSEQFSKGINVLANPSTLTPPSD